MASATNRQIAASMWKNRPSLPELIFLTIAVLLTHWLISMPLILPAAAALLLVAGGTLQQALADLRETASPPVEGGDDAED